MLFFTSRWDYFLLAIFAAGILLHIAALSNQLPRPQVWGKVGHLLLSLSLQWTVWRMYIPKFGVVILILLLLYTYASITALAYACYVHRTGRNGKKERNG